MLKLPLKFDSQGLVPAIVQDHITGEIRMFAFATDAAVRKTLETGRATFWSRSRGELWQKGRASGEVTPVVRVLADCDADCLIYSSDPHSPSCHSGAPSCFFQAVEGEHLAQASEQPQTLLAALEAAVGSPRRSALDGGYARGLLDAGAIAIASKIREKAGQFARALEQDGDERVVSEAADALYHVVVGLRSRSITLRRVSPSFRGASPGRRRLSRRRAVLRPGRRPRARAPTSARADRRDASIPRYPTS